MSQPNNTTFEILNGIVNIENLSYLELGLGTMENYKNIPCRDKTAVDNTIKFNDSFFGTTNEFFSKNKRKFDIIFIDACHEIDQVIIDYNNSVKCCNKFIFIHDLVPPNEAYAKPGFCSDSYKLLAYFLEKTNIRPLIWNEPFSMGLSLIYKPFQKIKFDNKYKNISYTKFREIIKDYKFYSREEIQSFIKEKINV